MMKQRVRRAQRQAPKVPRFADGGVVGGLDVEQLARKVGAADAVKLAQAQQALTSRAQAAGLPLPASGDVTLPGGMSYQALANKAGDKAASRALLEQQRLMLDGPSVAPLGGRQSARPAAPVPEPEQPDPGVTAQAPMMPALPALSGSSSKGADALLGLLARLAPQMGDEPRPRDPLMPWAATAGYAGGGLVLPPARPENQRVSGWSALANRGQVIDAAVEGVMGGGAQGARAVPPVAAPPAAADGDVPVPSMADIMRDIRAKHPPDARYAHGGAAWNAAAGGRVPTAARPGVDQVPALLDSPPGGPPEYVLPGDTVAAVGVPALDALRAATHDPRRVDQRRARAGQGAVGLASGGAISYGDWRPVDALDEYVRAARQRAVYGQAGDRVPAVTDAEMVARPVPKTRFGTDGGRANLPRPLPPGAPPVTASAEGMADTNWLGNTFRTESGPPGDTSPEAQPSRTGVAVANRMQAELPMMRSAIQEAAQTYQPAAPRAPILPLFNPAQAREQEHQEVMASRARWAQENPGPSLYVRGARATAEALNRLSGGVLQPLGEAMVAAPGAVGRAIDNSAPVQQQRALAAAVQDEARQQIKAQIGGGAGRQRPAQAPVVDARLAGGSGGAGVAPGRLAPRQDQGPGFDYTRPVPHLPGLFETRVAPDGRDKYGKTIYADSPFAATRAGLDAAVARSGQGVTSPPDFYNGAAVSGMTPAEYQAFKNQSAQDVQQTERDTQVLRQWQALSPEQQRLGRVPAEVVAAQGRPAITPSQAFAAGVEGRTRQGQMAALDMAAKQQGQERLEQIKAGVGAPAAWEKDFRGALDELGKPVAGDLNGAGGRPGLNEAGQAWAYQAGSVLRQVRPDLSALAAAGAVSEAAAGVLSEAQARATAAAELGRAPNHPTVIARAQELVARSRAAANARMDRLLGG